MTRLMRDSTTVSDIPVKGTEMVMVYRNGRYATTLDKVRSRFPSIPIVWIDVFGTKPSSCEVFDIEDQDGTPEMAPGWVKERWARVHPLWYPPVLYVNRANITPVYNHMAAAGLKIGSDFRVGISTLDGSKTVADMTGVTFVQYAGQRLTGGHYDESIVYDPTWHNPQTGLLVRGLTARLVRSRNRGQLWV